MYHAIEEVIVATKEKYQGVEKLSRNDYGCRYAHDINGVGCAIGCHLPPEVALGLDDNPEAGGTAITCVLFSRNGRSVIAEYFNLDTITTTDLARLQEAHDMSATVEEFLSLLDYRIDEGKWMEL